MEFPDTAVGIYHTRLHLVELQSTRHEANIRHPGEDWPGITNQKERKKLENRLNKRLSRLRRRRATYDDSSSDAVYCTAVFPETAPSPCGITSTFSHCSEEDAAQKRAMLEHFAE
ncbi:hypothetical protein A1F94_004035 [Pyrenophora tritici-repentis]|nr:hypothetical protein A1F94_004035 [Pyrenophora tritici-repentis]